MVKSLKSGLGCFIVLCIIFLLSPLPISAASARLGKITPVTIEGTLNSELPGKQEITIQLYHDNFHTMKIDEDVTYWFKNLPSGLKAKVNKYVLDNATLINIKIEGIAKETSEQLIQISIPKSHLKGDTDLEIMPNTEVRFHILENAPQKTLPISKKAALFEDVDWQSWYSVAVSNAVEKGFMNGTTDDKFEPNKPVTRAQVAEIFYRFKGSPKVNADQSFKDVSESDYFNDAVIWATQNGILKGKGNHKSAPNDNVTREELAVFLYRLSKVKKPETKLEPNLQCFCDHAQINVWALDAIYWAVSNGLMKGANDTSLCPQGHATRAEIAEIMMRYEKLDLSTATNPEEIKK